MDRLPLGALGSRQPRICPSGLIRRFALQLSVTVEPSLRQLVICDSFEHGAAGFDGMAAVAKATVFGQFLDICEDLLEPLRRRDADTLDPRCVDDESTTGQHEHLAMGCRVPAPSIGPQPAGDHRFFT